MGLVTACGMGMADLNRRWNGGFACSYRMGSWKTTASDRSQSISTPAENVVFLMVSGLFLGSPTMLNVLGLTRFIDLSFTVMGFDVPMPLAVGVLPYPDHLFCTDIISEMYGRKRASNVVWVGFMLNLWVAFILWLGGVLPPEVASILRRGFRP